MRFINQTDTDAGCRFVFIGHAGRYVLVDVGPAHCEERASQFQGEPRWYPFEPNAHERSAFAQTRLEPEQCLDGRR